ncbi:MAG: hypothetical protein HY884_05415 [Deltaproteobacteria bacterium]|nr:hypothetical protein [Deltaproteobacteria bacterium]
MGKIIPREKGSGSPKIPSRDIEKAVDVLRKPTVPVESPKLKTKIKEIVYGVPDVYGTTLATAPNLTKGKIKDKLEIHWMKSHPGAMLESDETRGRYRRRMGGAIVGAMGGSSGGVVGIIIGAAIGASMASKGHGQTKDYAISYFVSRAVTGIVGYIASIFSGSGLSATDAAELWAIWDWLKKILGVAEAAGVGSKKDKTPADADKTPSRDAAATATKAASVDTKKETQKTIGDDWMKVAAMAVSVIIVLGGR